MKLEPAISVADLPKAPGVKIIRAGEENAWRDAYRLMAEVKQIYASERERGYADGMAAASEEAAKLVSQTVAQVDRYLASLDKEVGELALGIVRRILSEFDDAELVARATYRALTDFREAKAIRIKVHPSVEPKVKEMLATRIGENAHGAPLVTIETDEDLSEESCVLSTEFAVIEATVETQLAAIAEAMGLPQRKTAP